jgi:hypothetical protein
MKKLLCLAGILGVILVAFIISVVRKPDFPILAVRYSMDDKYEELMVLKRDRTYEQLMRRKSNGIIFNHTGQWMPTTEDQAGYLLMKETHQNNVADYITIKDKVFHHPKDGTDELTHFMTPAGMTAQPDEKVLSLYKKWRAAAKPYVLPAPKKAAKSNAK